jgi:hypothetical protein
MLQKTDKNIPNLEKRMRNNNTVFLKGVVYLGRSLFIYTKIYYGVGCSGILSVANRTDLQHHFDFFSLEALKQRMRINFFLYRD